MDARKEGLIWVIKVLWLLGEDVNITHMPSFLDGDCMRFLLEYAKMDIERHELHHALNNLKMKSKRIRISNVYK